MNSKFLTLGELSVWGLAIKANKNLLTDIQTYLVYFLESSFQDFKLFHGTEFCAV